MTEIALSVILPALSGLERASVTLDCLRRQTRQDFEVVLVTRPAVQVQVPGLLVRHVEVEPPGLYVDAGITVAHLNISLWKPFLRHKFLGGWIFAGLRCEGWPMELISEADRRRLTPAPA